MKEYIALIAKLLGCFLLDLGMYLRELELTYKMES